jgi:hypothetical protein
VRSRLPPFTPLHVKSHCVVREVVPSLLRVFRFQRRSGFYYTSVGSGSGTRSTRELEHPTDRPIKYESTWIYYISDNLDVHSTMHVHPTSNVICPVSTKHS